MVALIVGLLQITAMACAHDLDKGRQSLSLAPPLSLAGPLRLAGLLQLAAPPFQGDPSLLANASHQPMFLSSLQGATFSTSSRAFQPRQISQNDNPETDVFHEVVFPPSVTEVYQVCLEAVAQHPDRGRRQALRWVSDGGGVPATYCAVAADLAAGHIRIAALRLSLRAGQLVEMGREASAAQLYAHAARLWRFAGEGAIAWEHIASALQLAPDSARYKIEGARIHHLREAWSEVIVLIDAAESLAPLSASDIALRGRAFLQTGEIKKAWAEVKLALERDPYNVDSLVLRGDLVRLGGLKE